MNFIITFIPSAHYPKVAINVAVVAFKAFCFFLLPSYCTNWMTSHFEFLGIALGNSKSTKVTNLYNYIHYELVHYFLQYWELDQLYAYSLSEAA